MKFPRASITFLTLVLFLAACSSTGDTGEAKTSDNTIRPKRKSPAKSVNTDTLFVAEKSAVFYWVDSVQIEKRKRAVGQDDFYVGADDYVFYMDTSWQFLDSLKLPLVEATGKKYIKFIGKNGSQSLVRVDRSEAICGIYFFDPVKSEKLVSMTDIEEEYKGYFNGTD